MFGLAFALGNAVYVDGGKIIQNGFFYGYNRIVLACIILQTFGGLIVAVVIKYSNNVTKAFASSLSIVISVIWDLIFSGYKLTFHIIIGILLVIIALIMYNSFKITDANKNEL